MVWVWTRDEAARDALALALSRFGFPFRVASGPADLALAVAQVGAELRVLVLGPSFTRAEAEAIHTDLPGSVAVVLLEDTLAPLPADVIAAAGPVERMQIPVRARTLRRLLTALLAS